jgi:hypothetical protein
MFNLTGIRSFDPKQPRAARNHTANAPCAILLLVTHEEDIKTTLQMEIKVLKVK